MLVQIDGNENGAAHNGDADENVSAHVCEAQEDGGVKSNLLYEFLLFRLHDGCNPVEYTLADRRWGVFGVGMS